MSNNVLCNIIQILTTFAIVTIAWMFFRLADINEALHAVKEIFTNPGKPFVDLTALVLALIPLAILIVKDLKDEYAADIRLMHSKSLIVSGGATALMIAFILLVGSFDNASFIYFQF